MKLAAKLTISLLAGAVLGLGLTWATVFRGTLGTSSDIRNGPWRTDLSIGSKASGAYMRASVAVHGLLALNRSETLYFTAITDSAGNAFDPACTYRVTGNDPRARWWSITAYAADDYLIPNPAGIYSVSKNSVRHDAAGHFSATVSRSAAPVNWIPVDDGGFSLTIRFYNPDPSVVADPAHADLPTIEKVHC